MKTELDIVVKPPFKTKGNYYLVPKEKFKALETENEELKKLIKVIYSSGNGRRWIMDEITKRFPELAKEYKEFAIS